MKTILIPLLLTSFSLLGQSNVLFSGSVSEDLQDKHVVLQCISEGDQINSLQVDQSGSFAVLVPVGMNSTVVFSADGHADMSVVINTENIQVDVSGYYAKQRFPFEIELKESNSASGSTSPSHYLYFSHVDGSLHVFEAREKVSEIARLFEE